MAERLEIEAIASKLTEAQRRYLLLVTPEGRTGCPRGQGHIAAKVLRSLPDGLIREAWGGDNYRFHLTDRGRDVRAYLTEGTEQVITDELVGQMAKAIHEHLCRRDIMTYLANDEDCESLARAALSASGLEALQAENERLRLALETADDAIREMFRYYDGGETRGSYDGRPERNQLRKAGYAARQALTAIKQESSDAS